MKQILTFALLLFFINLSYTQDYLDKIAEETCECLEKVDKNLDSEETQMQLGLCMLEASMPYQKKIKKDLNIDLTGGNMEKEWNKFGELLGGRMIQFCPKALVSLAGDMLKEGELKGEDLDYEIANTRTESVQGTITKIKDDMFVIFSLKGESGKMTNFYWLKFIESDFELVSDYKSLLDKSVEIHYQTEAFFDARIQEYRACHIITNIEILK